MLSGGEPASITAGLGLASAIFGTASTLVGMHKKQSQQPSSSGFPSLQANTDLPAALGVMGNQMQQGQVPQFGNTLGPQVPSFNLGQSGGFNTGGLPYFLSKLGG